MQRIVGGYIRGQSLLAVLIGVLVGGGMFAFHVPYAVLLGVLAFVLEFIPVLGTLLMHILEGDVIGPRIVGRAVGLGTPSFPWRPWLRAPNCCIWGALFASPVAGVLQALIVAVWVNWRTTHPKTFEQAQQNITDTVDEKLSDPPESTPLA